jgi:hypothetical protein
MEKSKELTAAMACLAFRARTAAENTGDDDDVAETGKKNIRTTAKSTAPSKDERQAVWVCTTGFSSRTFVAHVLRCRTRLGSLCWKKRLSRVGRPSSPCSWATGWLQPLETAKRRTRNGPSDQTRMRARSSRSVQTGIVTVLCSYNAFRSC